MLWIYKLFCLGRGKRARESIDYGIFDNETEYKDDDKFEASLLKLAKNVTAPSYSAYVSN